MSARAEPALVKRLRSLTDTILELLFLYLVIVGASAWLYGMAEDLPLLDALYWAFTTASTTGYGDISPKTLPGRAIAIVLMHVPVLIIPLLTARVAAKFIVDSDEWSHEEQEAVKRELRLIREMLESSGLSGGQSKAGVGALGNEPVPRG